MNKSREVRYFHLRNENRFPVACIASIWDETEDVIKFAVSTHNPLDTYSKKRAREIAALRLQHGKYNIVPVKAENIKWVVMVMITQNKFPADDHKAAYLPGRTIKAAHLWLKQFKARKEQEVKKSA